MRIPDKIIVGGVEYQVMYVNEFDLDDEESFHFGETDFKTAIIYLRNDLAPDVQYKAFLHELWHARLHEYGIVDLIDSSVIETVVELLTVAEMDTRTKVNEGVDEAVDMKAFYGLRV